MNTEWKPIASAPENEGRPLFCELCWGPEGDQATGSGFRLNGKWYAAGVFYCLGQEKRYELREVEVQPTHWKPRSDLPDEESAAPTSHPIPNGATGDAQMAAELMPKLQSLLNRMANDPRTGAMFEADGDTLRDAMHLCRSVTVCASIDAPAAGDAEVKS